MPEYATSSEEMRTLKSICFFNNKGGVGKTTLACNVASYLASHRNLRVLLVDADPQCNATSLVVEEQYLTRLYESTSRSTRGKHRKTANAHTLYDVLQPINAGEPDIQGNIRPWPLSKNRFRLDLLPGHPQVSMLEDKLSQAWLGFGGGDLGGARITNWSTQFADAVGDRYDLVFFDVGPSLGSLNRSVLVGADYFVTPMGCDVFSIMGITNIGRWLSKWLTAYDEAVSKCSQTWDVADYAIRLDASKVCRFIGYTVQQYITKSRAGQRRATKAYERWLSAIPPTIKDTLTPFFADHLTPDDLHLPDVPHMFSLVPLAQNANAPIHAMEAADGLVGAQYQQKDQYVEFIDKLAAAILKNVPLDLQKTYD